MAEHRFRIGIIGLGIIGRSVMGPFQQESRTAIRAVCDTNAQLAESTARDLGDIAWSTDYRAMLEGDQVDLVYVAVPPKFHHRIALDVIAAGKHIFCEKPLALTLQEAQEMTDAAQRAGIIQAIHLPLHYNAGARLFSREVRSGRLGDLKRIAIDLVFPQWPRDWQMNPWVGEREQGGALREVGPHIFDQLLSNFGPVRRVYARTEYPPDSSGAEDSAIGLLELASGQLATVSLLCNVAQPELVRLTAYGSACTLHLSEWARNLTVQDKGDPEPITDPEPTPRRLLPNLLDALEGKPSDLCSFEQGLAIQRVLDAWERSAVADTWADIGD